MSRKSTQTILLIFLALAVVLFSTSCEKLKISNLQANHHFSRANYNFTEGKYRLAIEEYEKALEYNPDLMEAYQFLGESYKVMYKPGVEDEENMEVAQKALDALQKAYEIKPNNRDIINSLGDMYDKMNNFEEAEKMYLKVLDLEPTNMANYYVVAGFYKRYAASSSSEEEEGEEGSGEESTEEGQSGSTPFQKAEEMYLRRIELDPDNPQGYAYIAQFYDQITPVPKFDEAVRYHRYQAELEPDNAVTYYAIGVNRFFYAYRLQNQLSRAKRIELGRECEEALNKAIELDPGYPEPYAYMNLLYRNIWASVYPERRQSSVAEADRWGEQFQEARRRVAERKRLEDELKKGEIK